MFTYRNLDAWKRGIVLVVACYRATRAFPRDEQYGLVSQTRRAAVSIPCNIAEGHCRRTTAAYANHVSIAIGSHGELETCLDIAMELGFLSRKEHDTLLEQCATVGRLLSGLHRSLVRKMAKGRGRS